MPSLFLWVDRTHSKIYRVYALGTIVKRRAESEKFGQQGHARKGGKALHQSGGILLIQS